nr:immunoglobulin heavy chain junction region [Mus musculus]MBK4195148.1 immunoglobulin heavy chain junction region [Mus musculus]MBK4195149.1 immunoglobulin heavy chain junction region [Mus musculus]
CTDGSSLAWFAYW